ncbi:HD-GYP domain-containing protein (c-di-GMP phosphodiesterase class II) [Evansella vedderi]|uniref:HD-GYP domain-containing protein (C-di-GMP phosphodiesterase class II) n=1 Tax=Evansella vedderi TaxID=38282 RepID=A0ABU0A233_9BACI|nr:HD-GYP domain-containing protein [Evansella vedderi]MDQ0257553.1 HD-GYP domain-containing protein (c-di-GMP phosphodiesterase class II) [Evansella vedderi]
MKVKTEYLVPGVILSDDVYIRTTSPIIKKKTVLSDEHINILKKFLVSDVLVELKLVDGTAYKPQDTLKEENLDKIDKKNNFIDQFLFAVQQYKKLFTHWQGGAKVDAYTVRKIFLPLYETNPSKEDLLQLHHYGTKNDYIYFHSLAVSILSSSLGKKIGLSNGEIIQLGLSGLLADCGMAKLAFNVFEKKAPLSIDEYEEVKNHPLLSYKMLEDVPGFSKGALLGVIQHHERENGSGYPMKIKGKKMHLFAKIIIICDIYHAMTSERHYRAKQSPYKVIESLKKDQFGKIDHIVLSSFINMMLNLTIGKKVRLNNGLVGEVIFINENEPTRPMINVENDKMFNLTSHPEVFIEEVF